MVRVDQQHGTGGIGSTPFTNRPKKDLFEFRLVMRKQHQWRSTQLLGLLHHSCAYVLVLLGVFFDEDYFHGNVTFSGGADEFFFDELTGLIKERGVVLDRIE